MESGTGNILFFLILFLFFLGLYRRRGYNKIGLFLLGVYAISIICSLLLYEFTRYTGLWDVYDNITLFPYLYWLMIFAINFHPIYKFDHAKITNVVYDIRVVNILSIIGLLVSIVPFFELLLQTKAVFASGAGIANSISDVHDDGDKKLMLSSIGNLCLRGVWALYDMAFLLVYPLIKEKKKNIFALLGVVMIILTRNLQNIALVSRGGLMTFFFQIIIAGMIYFPLLSESQKRMAKKVGTSLLGLFFGFFLIITLARASTYQEKEDNYSLAAFIVRYLGEGTLNFNQYVFDVKENAGGELTMYLPRKLLGVPTNEADRAYLLREINSKTGIPENIFYTYIGWFVQDIGPFWTFCVLLSMGLCACRLLQNVSGRIHFRTLFLFFIYLKIMSFGFIGYAFFSKESEFFLLYIFYYFLFKSLRM